MKNSTNPPMKADYLSPCLEEVSAELQTTILDQSGLVENPDKGEEWGWD